MKTTRLTTRTVLLSFVLLFAGFGILFGPETAEAVVVGTGTGSQNTTAPADDFGFGNVGVCSNCSAVYLGYGWVMTASHVGTNKVNFNGTYYDYLPESEVRLTNDPSLGFDADYTDLKLFKLTEDPGLRSVNISSQTVSHGEEITMVGHGYNRAPEMTYWKDNPAGGTWIETNVPYYYRGYYLEGGRTMRWGTNVLQMVDDNDNRTSADNCILTLGSTQTMAYKTSFTSYGETDSEAQVVAGDSGGGVFYKNGDQWELCGIIHAATAPFPDQPCQTVLYGNSSYLSDLSFYQDQILDIITPIPGDANFDGFVDAQDFALLMDYWQQDSDYLWGHGDFNEDGFVDASDFAYLMDNWQYGHETNGSVPEPSSWLLLITLFFGMAIWNFRKRAAVA